MEVYKVRLRWPKFRRGPAKTRSRLGSAWDGEDEREMNWVAIFPFM